MIASAQLPGTMYIMFTNKSSAMPIRMSVSYNDRSFVAFVTSSITILR